MHYTVISIKFFKRVETRLPSTRVFNRIAFSNINFTHQNRKFIKSSGDYSNNNREYNTTHFINIEKLELP